MVSPASTWLRLVNRQDLPLQSLWMFHGISWDFMGSNGFFTLIEVSRWNSPDCYRTATDVRAVFPSFVLGLFFV